MLGIGDDCAIVRPRGAGEDWLYTTDMLIEGTHFRRETHGARMWMKALARGLSDIAAMGGEARFCLLSLALAGWVDARWLDGFYDGLAGARQACRGGVDRRGFGADGSGDVRHRGGGDRAAGEGTAAGRARGPATRFMSRVRSGGSALGLASERGKAWLRHKRPEPRLALDGFCAPVWVPRRRWT